MKDSGLRIRVELELRDKFTIACWANDRPAAQVIRDFMRRYIDDNTAAHDTQATKKKTGKS